MSLEFARLLLFSDSLYCLLREIAKLTCDRVQLWIFYAPASTPWDRIRAWKTSKYDIGFRNCRLDPDQESRADFSV
jgi:hypothetical protein